MPSDRFGDELEQRLDALEAWQDAAVTKMKRLGEENERLRDRVAELEELVDPDPGGVAYEQLTSDQKVHRIRVALLEQATAGKAPTMKYDDVRWLFDGKPSAGHAYDLMERVANADGYVYETGGHGDGQKRIRVEPDAVNDERIVHAVNNGTAEVGA